MLAYHMMHKHLSRAHCIHSQRQITDRRIKKCFPTHSNETTGVQSKDASMLGADSATHALAGVHRAAHKQGHVCVTCTDLTYTDSRHCRPAHTPQDTSVKTASAKATGALQMGSYRVHIPTGTGTGLCVPAGRPVG